MKSLRKAQKKQKKRRKIKRLPPTAAAARDEGPRLLPLSDRAKEPSRLEHYLELADSALHRSHARPGKGNWVIKRRGATI